MTYDVAGLDFLHAGKGDWVSLSSTTNVQAHSLLRCRASATAWPITTNLVCGCAVDFSHSHLILVLKVIR